MSKTEKTEISDLRRYMEKSLAEHYTQVITFKDREDSFVSLYAHKDSGQKVLLRRSGNRNDGVYRALRGKRLCNLPMVLEVCSEEAHLLVLEEYIEGRTLDKILDSGQLTSAQAAAYTTDLCHALEELHNLGIVHRDIKPANVMITPENRAVLLDLSIAREISSDQQDTRSLGTVGYAAPEQYQGYLRPGSDIYALGKTLEKLCGKKKWQWILYPDFFLLLFRCTRKQEKYRYSDMSVVQKKIQKLENRYRMITWRKRFLEAAAVGILIGTLILIAGLLKTEEFSVAISEVTDLYYEARQYPEDSKDREKCCMAAEKRLQRLSRNYGGKEQQRRIELLLAWNAELLCEPEKAALYYENLLLYDAEYPVAYGEYGMFLIRTGQKEAS